MIVAAVAISSEVRRPSSNFAVLSLAVPGSRPSGWSQVKSPSGGPMSGIPVTSVAVTLSSAYLPLGV